MEFCRATRSLLKFPLAACVVRTAAPKGGGGGGAAYEEHKYTTTAHTGAECAGSAEVTKSHGGRVGTCREACATADFCIILNYMIVCLFAVTKIAHRPSLPSMRS